jgi:hypothetical protein
MSLIFDDIDVVEEAWGKDEPAEILLMDIYKYLSLKEALGYDDLDEEVTRYHGYKVIVVPDAENLLELR